MGPGSLPPVRRIHPLRKWGCVAELYEVELKGHLDAKRMRWFGEMEIRLLPDGRTILRGAVTDQAALYGLLNKVRDLGLPLLAVRKVDSENV